MGAVLFFEFFLDVEMTTAQVTMITEAIRNNFESRFGDGSSLGGQLTQIHHHLFPYFIFPVMNILLTSRFVKILFGNVFSTQIHFLFDTNPFINVKSADSWAENTEI